MSAHDLSVSRRRFIAGGAAAAGSLTFGLHLAGCAGTRAGAEAAFVPNAWVRVDRSGVVTLQCHKTEMGQGVFTAIPMILAEELDVPMSAVRVEMAPSLRVYARGRGDNLMITSNSESIRDNFDKLRHAGASAREMLVGAAAQRWGVDATTCSTHEGRVRHAASGREAGYGELVEAAARLAPPASPRLKDPARFTIVGKPHPRLDTPAKVSGQAVFGMDVRVPGMLVAVVAKAPALGAKLVRHDAAAARRMPGVRDVVVIDSGVAVVADHYWAAKRGRDVLEADWDESANKALSSESIAALYEDLLRRPGKPARLTGDVTGAERNAVRTVSATFEAPYLAHATMEPMNCTAHVQADRCDVWAPTQTQTRSQEAAARISGLPLDKVHVHTTFVGGGFGRRLETDYVRDAVQVSKAVGRPVKVVWSREDDFRHDVYRPATRHQLSAALDARGMPLLWRARIVAPSILQRFRPPANGIDSTSLSGVAEPPYDIAAADVELVWQETGVPVGFWRSVGPSQNVFSTECFVDELAAAAGQDPYQYRRALLTGNPRLRRVLDRAAEVSGWQQPAPAGVYRGISCYEYVKSCWIAQVVELQAQPDRSLRIRRIHGVLDAGLIINPDTVAAQIQGGILHGLGAALHERITVDAGRIQQSNFHDYSVLRIHEAPGVDVHVMPSSEPPGRVGETSLPAVAPALANAIFAATGKRIRSMPIPLSDLRLP